MLYSQVLLLLLKCPSIHVTCTQRGVNILLPNNMIIMGIVLLSMATKPLLLCVCLSCSYPIGIHMQIQWVIMPLQLYSYLVCSFPKGVSTKSLDKLGTNGVSLTYMLLDKHFEDLKRGVDCVHL